MLETRRNLPTPYRLVVTTAATLAVMLVFTIVLDLMADGISPGFANKDFANYWTGGKLALNDRAMDLFGPQAIYFAHLTSVFGADYQWHNWSYPPHYLLLIWPLGLLGYKAAMLLFLGVTGAFYAWALRAFTGLGNWIALVASGPFIVYNIWTAQNGFLSAGLALGALALREHRPIVAGILLGVMTVKPQLGILFPFLLLAERRWTLIASAACTTLALIGLSAAVFGIEAWKGYLDEVVPYQALVMRELGGAFLVMLPSVYGSFRRWGFDADPALMAHLIVAIPVFLVTVAAFFRVADSRWRAILLLIATFIVTPYALTYDLGMAAAAIGLMVAPFAADHPDDGPRLQFLFAVAMLVPIWMMPIGTIWLPLAPVILLGVFGVALVRSGVLDGFGLREDLLQRRN